MDTGTPKLPCGHPALMKVMNVRIEGYEVRVTETTDYTVSFDAFEIVGWSDAEQIHATEFAKRLSGMIKFDGCSHLWFVDGPPTWEPDKEEVVGYWHLCGKADWERVIAFLPKLYSEMTKLIKRYDARLAS